MEAVISPVSVDQFDELRHSESNGELYVLQTHLSGVEEVYFSEDKELNKSLVLLLDKVMALLKAAR